MKIEMEKKYLSTAEAAEYLNMSTSILEQWRRKGKGPVFFKMGKKTVRYTIEELDKFIGEPLTKLLG